MFQSTFKLSNNTNQLDWDSATLDASLIQVNVSEMLCDALSSEMTSFGKGHSQRFNEHTIFYLKFGHLRINPKLKVKAWAWKPTNHSSSLLPLSRRCRPNDLKAAAASSNGATTGVAGACCTAAPSKALAKPFLGVTISSKRFSNFSCTSQETTKRTSKDQWCMLLTVWLFQ